MKPKTSVKLDRTVGRWVYAVHLSLYRLTGGAIGHKTSTGPILLLTTTGRKSGQVRTTPLLYMPDGDSYLVVGSNGGRPNPPSWFLNVRDKPTVSLQVGRLKMDAAAQVLDSGEKETVWPRLVNHYPGWDHYTTLTDRDIPVVRLRPKVNVSSNSH